MGNNVTGNNSGAFGDPSLVTGEGSYSIGNNNTITTNDTFVLGSGVNRGQTDVGNVSKSLNGTVGNSVYLGKDSEATAGNVVGTKALKSDQTAGTTTTAGDKGTVSSATVKGITYGGFAGATANGVVTIGASGSERRLQNVAAGEISETSTDAINGSQLYAVMKEMPAVVAGDNITVVKGTNATTGQVEYKVSGKKTGEAATDTNTQVSVNSTDKTVKISPTANENGTTNYDLAVNVDGTSIVKKCRWQFERCHHHFEQQHQW